MSNEFDAELFMKHRKIDESDISSAMAENADLLGYYGYQESLWKSSYEKLSLQLDSVSANVELNIKEEGGKITEATAKARVACDKNVQELKKSLLVAKEQTTLYNMAVKTIEQRGKMLISLGAWQRSEMDNINLSITRKNPKGLSANDKASLLERIVENSG